MQCKIFKIIANQYTLKCQGLEQEIIFPLAGKLRLNNFSPVVGDNVIVENGLIVEVLERENSFIRPKVANVDQMIVFMSIKEPEFQNYLVDKYLATIESKDIKPIIFLTKVDLDLDLANQIKDLYQKMGYSVYLIDNKNEQQLNLPENLFTDKYNVFMGQTGVGKTTTLNKLGNFNYQTQEISKALNRGKHTTRNVAISKLLNGYLIDTPGFSSLDLFLSPIELAQSFKTFKELSKTCKFRNCLHINESESNCAIKQNLNTDLIPQIRYNNYIKMQNELKGTK
ncbi:ribosome small subunit-dependent GTPase A [Mycoplasma nasistruthionis]|uniref:Small ribosomal subunit biogenesis GTPase RsgA n=1 Tax=Mycoplasma nasistruthionis TaxID=353852 RepID=A0A4Y6I728_9MOLU|nr:ribosome small subunit-dependent GTPase A [Mycoplasma nasistruthionis]QDF65047.1 ribosome small subunit-dependent GTPase A [Mycoplasma nasistruthionis]